MQNQEIKELKGLVATVSLTGTVRDLTAQYLSNMRSFNDRNGLHNVEYKMFPATLVEAGRDSVAQHALDNGYSWILHIDADAAPFADFATQYFLTKAFIEFPQYDVIGAYCQTRSETGQPTIDTGSGKWEEHYPGEGVIPVIRTGAHFLFTKTIAFKRFPAPWFRTRVPLSPAKAMRDIDSFARTKLGGHNPLTEHPEWHTLVREASRLAPAPMESPVGEDSGFCDNLRAAGGLIAVDTDFVVGHVNTDIILPDRFVKAMNEHRLRQRLAVGVME